MRVFAITAVAAGVVASPAGAQQRPAAGTTTGYVPPATLLGDDGQPAAGGPGCSVPNITASPSGDAIYFSNGGRSDVFRMTTANQKGEGAGQFSIFNFPDRPYSTNPNQREVHVHDLSFNAAGNLVVTNPHRNPGPTGVASGVGQLTQALQLVNNVDIPNEPEVGNQSFLGGIYGAPNGDVWVVSSEFTGPEEITLVRPDGTTRSYVITPEGQPGPSLGGPLVFANGYVWATGSMTVLNTDTPDPTDTRASDVGVVVRLDPNTGQVTLVDQHAGYIPGRMELGPDGAIYYVEQQRVANPMFGMPGAPFNTPRYFTGATGRIARLDPATGQATHYTLPAGSNPVGLTFGGDGRIWFTSAAPAGTAANPTGARQFVGALDTDSGQVQEFATPAGARGLADIDTGQAGDVYFSYQTAAGQCAIGSIWVCSGNQGQGQGRGRSVCAPGQGGLPRGQGQNR
ncbi:MAG: hypothetical protein M3378_03425 [Actinomycetota bacterium]|nr:hypothetical protein [Actinomycetota bacterium]